MAISMRLYTRRRTAVATATRLPRRGNLDEVEHTSANRRCYTTRLPRYARNDKVGMREGVRALDFRLAAG